MEKNLTPMLVVAAAIFREDGRVLLHRRPAGGANVRLWEFPGGKVEPGETPPQALCREVAEESAILLEPQSLVPAGFAAGGSGEGGREIVLLLYRTEFPGGSIRALEGGTFAWFTLREVAQLDLGPLDRELLQGLQPSFGNALG